MVIGVLVGLLVGLALGWLAHRAVSLNYRKRWLELVDLMNTKALESPDDASLPIRPAPDPMTRSAPPRPYVHGKWALEERKGEGQAVKFYAIRMGFDDVLLGTATTRYMGLYKMGRSNAEQAVAEMNERP